MQIDKLFILYSVDLYNIKKIYISDHKNNCNKYTFPWSVLKNNITDLMPRC